MKSFLKFDSPPSSSQLTTSPNLEPLTTTMLKYKEADQIAAKVLEVARANKLNPMCVVVLDARGATLSAKMEDGNPLYREHIARGKAMGALGLGVDSGNMVKMYNDRPFFMNAIFSMQQNLVPVPGGVLVRDAKTNAVLGAVEPGRAVVLESGAARVLAAEEHQRISREQGPCEREEDSRVALSPSR